MGIWTRGKMILKAILLFLTARTGPEFPGGNQNEKCWKIVPDFFQGKQSRSFCIISAVINEFNFDLVNFSLIGF